MRDWSGFGLTKFSGCARLKVFYDEELDVPLVLFNEVLDHVFRIDRIFKQNQVSVCQLARAMVWNVCDLCY